MFAGGCGRVLEGQPNDLWQSLNKLTQLPDETLIFCGHEYTVDNLRFALTLEPANKELQERLSKTERLQQAGKPSVPSTLVEERRTNPFLRANSPDIRRALNMEHAPDFEVFAAVRRRKDVF
jgi:hydroxyacylglutathione hydrolase